MNLQLCIPYQKCPFNCPMCIAKDPFNFYNLYKYNCFLYFNNLRKILIENKFHSIILTGDTEPTLNKKWLNDVVNECKISCSSQIEIQTHNYNWEGMEGIDVNAFSVATIDDLKKIPLIKTKFGLNRIVILGDKNLIKYLYNKSIELNQFKQVTFKLLQNSNSKVKYIDDYINNNKCTIELINMLKDKYIKQNKQVLIDFNCQASYNRYKIFRENGILYNAWEEK